MSQDEMIGKLLAFLDASPSPYHAVTNLSTRLADKGFKKLYETSSWSNDIKLGGKYYFTRNGSAMVAFCIGRQFVIKDIIQLLYYNLIFLERREWNQDGCCTYG